MLKGNTGKKRVLAFICMLFIACLYSFMYPISSAAAANNPPEGSIAIAGTQIGNTAYVNGKAVTVQLSAKDDKDGPASIEMRISNITKVKNQYIFGNWEKFNTTKSLSISNLEDGVKFVYVQYRDGSKKESSIYEGTFILDNTAPNGGILINAGSACTRKREVTLTLNASDAGSGVAYAELSNDRNSWTKVDLNAAGVTNIQWMLPEGDGEKKVYVRYTDKLGNVSNEFSGTIQLRTSDLDMKINITPSAVTQDTVTLDIAVETGCPEGLLYQIWGEDLNGWTILKSYDMNSTCTWNALRTEDNQYRVHVRIKDAETMAVCGQKTIIADGKHIGLLKIDSIDTSSKEGIVNKPVTITASVSGGNASQYEFIIRDGAGIAAGSGVIQSNSYSWIPDKVGNYNITVRVSGTDNQSYEASILFQVVDPYYQYPELSGIGIVKAGDELINITAQKKYDIASWEYSFGIGESMRGSTLKTPYMPNTNSFVWNPWSGDQKKLGSGIYEIWAYVRDRYSAQYEDAVRDYIAIPNPDGAVALDINAYDITLRDAPVGLQNNSVINKGTSVKITTASNPDRELEYSFWLLDEKGYRLVREYRSIDSGDPKWNTYEWTGFKSGVYTLLTRVREKGVSGSYEAEKSVTLKVVDSEHPEIANINIGAIKVTGSEPGSIKKRTEVRLEVEASGTDKLMYFFAVTDDLYKWRTLRHFSPDNNYTWIPKKAGKYTIIVWVKDAASGSLEKTAQQEVIVTD